MKNAISSHWAMRVVAVAVIVFVGRLTASEAAPANTAPEGCTYQCASGAGVSCLSGWHKLWSDPTKNAGGEFHADCHTGECSTYHSCTPDPEAPTPMALADEITQALNGHDAATVTAVVLREPQRVSINEPRSAVQVTNCAGEVVAHLPVDRSILVALLTAQQSR